MISPRSKPFRSTDAVLEFVHVRKGISVRSGYLVHSAVVDTQSGASAVALGYEEHRGRARRFRGPNGAHFSRLLEPLPELFKPHLVEGADGAPGWSRLPWVRLHGHPGRS